MSTVSGPSGPPVRPPLAPLSQERNAQFSFHTLWPHIEEFANQYGADAEVLSGIIMQESSFKNWGVHADGTGHGLIGLDDNGLLPDFERFTGRSFGRGPQALTIPPELQIEYLAKTIASFTATYGNDPFAAARVWHRGPRNRNDSRGQLYERLIRRRIRTLFPDRQARLAGIAARRSGESYVVRRGDSLWALATRLRGQGIPGSCWDIIRTIQALNPGLTNPDRIYEGQSLRLPVVAESSFEPGML